MAAGTAPKSAGESEVVAVPARYKVFVAVLSRKCPLIVGEGAEGGHLPQIVESDRNG